MADVSYTEYSRVLQSAGAAQDQLLNCTKMSHELRSTIPQLKATIARYEAFVAAYDAHVSYKFDGKRWDRHEAMVAARAAIDTAG